MSKTVDERVVSMQFDNKNFESNVKTTMSTLDKLKKSLNLEKSAKGLENINSAAKNCNLSPMANAVESVKSKFSALEVMGITALANITNSAVNYGKRLVSAFTVDPLRTGFNEFELKMGSIQTIMASTGESLETVNKYLNELNEYSDRTIYSFSDMTSNIGKFTNAGVKLEDAVLAIKGISNEAAISGANANEASRAMYNFAQALSAGYVKLIDWKSIENANMATVGFKQQLIDTAVAVGTLTKTTDGYKTSSGTVITPTKNFNESLQDQWMTTEVLVGTLKNYADETTDIGEKAFGAAQDVKTFSMMMDTLKEAAQSGWAATWELIVGDFEQGKALWTKVSKVLGDVIDKSAKARNKLIGEALNSSQSKWDDYIKKVNKAGIKTEEFEKALTKTAKKHGIAIDKMIKEEGSFSKTLKRGWLTKKIFVETLEGFADKTTKISKSTEDMTKKLKTFQKVVDQVWRGDFKNGTERMKALTEAGYDYYKVQDLVNKTVDGHRLTLEDLSDVQLKNVGYTDNQINAIRKLADEAKKSGKSIDDLINSFSKPTGRELLIDSFRNLWEAITKPLNSIKQAWDDTIGKNINSENLYKLIEGFNKLTESLIISDDSASNFKKVMEGLFSLFQLTVGVLNKSLTTGLKVLKATLNLFGTDLSTVLGIVGDYIKKFKEWVDEHTLIVGAIDKVAAILYTVIDGIYRCTKAFLGLVPVKKFIDNLKNSIKDFFASFNISEDKLNFDSFVQGIKSFFDKLEENIKNLDWKNFGINIVKGLASGIYSGASKAVTAIINLGKSIVEAFCNLLGIESPAKLFIALGGNITKGLSIGIRSAFSNAIAAIISLGKAIIEAFCKLLKIHSPSRLFITLGGFIVLGLVKGITDGFDSVWETIKSLALGIYNTMDDSLANVLPKIYESIKVIGSKLYDAFKSWDFDFGSLVVASSIITFLVILNKLAKIAEKAVNPFDKLGGTFGVIKEYIAKVGKAKRFNLVSEGIKNLAISIVLLSGAFYMLSKLDWGSVARGSVAILAISGALALLAASIRKQDAIDVAKISAFMLGFSVAITLMAAAMKILSGIYIDDIWGPIIMLTAMMTGMIIALRILGDAVSDPKTGKGIKKAGGMFVKMAVSIAIMALVIKTIAGIPQEDINKAMDVMAAIFLMYASMALLGSVSKNAWQVGSMLLNMSLAIGVMVIIIKQIAGIREGDILKGLFVIAAIEFLFADIIYISIFAGQHASKAGSMLLKMAFAIGVLAIAMKMIATLSYEDILKGGVVLSGVQTLFLRFIYISKICGDEANKAGSMMFKMAAGMALMALAIKVIATVPTGDIIKGLVFIAAVEVLFGAMVNITRFSGEHADKAGTMMLKMSAGILVLVAAIAILSLLDPKDIAVGTAAIVAMIVSLAAVANAASKLGDCTKQLLIIGGIIAILVGAVVGLSFIEKDKLLAATESISAIIGMFALLLVATKYAKAFDVGMAKSLGAMLAVIVALGAILWAIQELEIGSSIETVASMSLLLLAMAAAIRILSGGDYNAKSLTIALVATLLMSVVLAAIGGVLWLLKKMDVSTSIETAAALSVLLLAMASAVRILAGGKCDIKSLTIALVATLLMSVILASIGGVLLLLKKMDVTPSIETAIALSVMLLAFAGTVAILGLIGPLAIGALVGAAAMAGVIDVLKDVMIGLGELVTETPMAEKFLDKGIKVLKKIGTGLGEFISSIGVGITSGLPKIGENISKFMDAIGAIKPETAKSIDMVAEAISTISKAGLNDKISKILGFGGLFGDLKTEFSGVGEGLNSFITELGTFTPEQIESVESACEVLNALSKASKNIDGQADWAKTIFGDNGLGAFTGNLSGVGKNLKDFVGDLGTITEEQLDSVKIACSVVKELSKAGEEIDGQADWAKAVFGDNGLGAFTSDLSDVGENLKDFVGKLGILTEEQLASVKIACSVITELSKAGGEIDGQAEWAKKIFGDNGLGAFSGDLPTVASNLSDFVGKLGTFGEEKIATVRSAVGVVNALANLSESNIQTLITYLPSLGTYMLNFADDLVSFCDTLKGTDADSLTSSVSTAINNIVSIASESYDDMNTVGSDLASAIADGFASNASPMKNALYAVLNAAKASVTNGVMFTFTGEKLGSSLITGFNNKEEGIKKAATKLAKAAKTAITDCKEDFVEAGKDLGRGLIKGIKDKEDDVYDAGFALGQTAVKGEHDGQQSASPSKLTIKAGKWLGEGLVIGMTRMGKAVYKSGYDMGDNAINAVSNAIASISDVVNSDVDSQPTIRPVMDLDDVRSGMDTMNRMLGATPSVGVLANVNAIRSSMNRDQNGANDDVVSAINKLRKDVGNLENKSYNFGNITYSSGDEVSNAIDTLVRAFVVEGRV